jgi:hypothetical protein
VKTIFLTTLFALFAISVTGQKLLDIYNSGTVKLVPDPEYGKDNDWDIVFQSYYDTLFGGAPMGNRKSLTIMPDNSVVISHAYRNFYSKFSPSGNFEREFGIKKDNGQQLKKIKPIEGIINNNIFFTGVDNVGNMICFNFNGEYIKTLKLDYATRQLISLPNNNIAAVGWVIWKDKFREFVSLIDYETNEEKIIWDYFTERHRESRTRKPFNYSYTFKKGGGFSFNTMPFTKITGMSEPPKIALINNNIIVTIPTTGKIIVYDLNGTKLSEDNIDWAINYISIEEQMEIQQKGIDRFREYIKDPRLENILSTEEGKLAFDRILQEMKKDLKNIKEPLPYPTFSTIIKDSDGNLLFFEYPKEENSNKFNVWVYENNGKFVAQSSFVCEDYNLEINASKMVFHNGYIYGLQLLKNATGVPLRLVRFNLTSE